MTTGDQIARAEAEDERLLRYAGLLGHIFVGISGEPGHRRTIVEANTLASARAAVAGMAQPVVYQRVYSRKQSGRAWRRA